jgi:hypothetical protein
MDLIKRIWNGELPLVKIYWVYGVLVGLLLRIFVEVSYPFVSISHLQLYSYFLIAVLIPYQILISVGIWRSATAYTEVQVWAILAKIAAVIGLLTVLGLAFKSLNDEASNIYELNETATILNKTLPSQIDKETRWDKVDTVNDSFNYYYTLVNYVNSKELVELIQKNIRGAVTANACTDKGLKHILDLDIPIVYIYSDKDGTEITRIIVDKTQCLN